jgi:hypothetical protein
MNPTEFKRFMLKRDGIDSFPRCIYLTFWRTISNSDFAFKFRLPPSMRKEIRPWINALQLLFTLRRNLRPFRCDVSTKKHLIVHRLKSRGPMEPESLNPVSSVNCFNLHSIRNRCPKRTTWDHNLL